MKKDFKIESVEEMLAEFKRIKEEVDKAIIKSEAVLASADSENILEVITKKITKFGERGGHAILPGKYIDHEIKVIVRKNEKTKI